MKPPLEYSRKYAKHTLQHTLNRRPSDKLIASIEKADDLRLEEREALMNGNFDGVSGVYSAVQYAALVERR